MELTTEQQTKLSELKETLEEELWDKFYYEDENPVLWELYNQGVELNFGLELQPYEGKNFKG